ncbi:hypothetical protein OG21DRAFT_1506350 [Imleria badia]|nr:hypothetical protein OG21DRAFT_1506350 [Imleria badia]
MSIPSNGQYTIFNAKFTTQDVDLLLGNPTSTIGGVVNNDHSMYMVWNFNTADSTTTPNFTLTNTATTAKGAYASVDRTATVSISTAFKLKFL